MTSKRLDELVLLAVKHIQNAKSKTMRPYAKTIASFLMGAKSSPYYDFYRRHKDVCGSVENYISDDVVLDSLLRLERKGYLSKELSKNGKYVFSLKGKVKSNKSSKTSSKPKLEVGEYFLIRNKSSKIVRVGKIKKINKRDKILVDTNNKMLSLEMAKPISRDEYLKLKKELDKSEKKPSTKTTTQKQNDGEVVLFYEAANSDERKILREFKQLIGELLPDHELQNKISTYGFVPKFFEGEFPIKRCWISRDPKNRKLILKFKKEPTSTEKVLPLSTKRHIEEAWRQLRVAYARDVYEIEDIVNRIKNKDTFSDYQTDNLETISLMPHQKAGVELASSYDRFAFFYDTGTGKTVMALEIMMNKHRLNGSRFLVVAPKPLIKSAWMDDSLYFPKMKLLPLSKNMSAEDYARIYDRWEEMDGKKKAFTDEDGMLLEKIPNKIKEDIKNDLIRRADHFIVNIDAIRKPKDGDALLKQINCNGLIIDESAIIKNYETESAKRMRVFARKMQYVYLLSGKPAPNSTIEYYSQMVIVDPATFNIPFGSFVSMYYKRVGMSRLVDKNDHTRKEVAKMAGNRSIIVQKEECISLPQYFTSRVTVELDNETAKFYDDVMNNFMTEIMDMNGKKVRVQALTRLASIMKLREIASGFYLDSDNSYRINRHKVDEIVSLLDEIGYDALGRRNKVLIWCTFKYEIKVLQEELLKRGYKVVTCYSDTAKYQDENIAAFKHGDAEIMIAHPQTLKYGITFTNCHYCIFSSMSYSFEDYYQAHDRIYRKGQTEICNFYHLLSEDTIDEVIYRCVTEKATKAKLFERLVKSASKHGWPKEDIYKTLHTPEEVRNIVTRDSEF